MPLPDIRGIAASFTSGSFVRRLKQSSDNESVEVLLVQGENQHGDQCYAYLAIVASLIRDLELCLKLGVTNIEDFGVIIASGQGSPAAETVNYISENFLQIPAE